MKFLFLALSSFLAIIAQVIAGNNFFLFNFLDLSLVLVAYWALYRNRTQALFLGSFAGLLMDAVFGWPLGFNGFGKTVAAYLISQVARRIVLDAVWIRFSVVAASSLASSLSIFLLFLALKRSASSVLLGASLVQAIITGGVAALVFAAVDAYNRMNTRKA